MAELPISGPDQVGQFKSGLREIAHEMNNCLGVLRTASYLMETNKDETKRKHYLAMINAGIDRLEDSLRRLRALRESPATLPSETTLSTGQQ